MFGKRQSGDGCQRWYRREVHLHADQHRFLVSLAREMGVTASRALRRILAYFIDTEDGSCNSESVVEAAKTRIVEYERARARHPAADEFDDWMTTAVNIRERELRFICELSDALDASHSRVMRRLLAVFVDSLGEGPETR